MPILLSRSSNPGNSGCYFVSVFFGNVARQCRHNVVCTEPERECKPLCVPIPPEGDDLIADDTAVCSFITDEIPCRWVCNGTCFVEGLSGATEVGTIYIDTEPRDVDEIAQYAASCNNLSILLELESSDKGLCSFDKGTIIGVRT